MFRVPLVRDVPAGDDLQPGAAEGGEEGQGGRDPAGDSQGRGWDGLRLSCKCIIGIQNESIKQI